MKAAVEAAVQVAERWVLAPLRKQRFFSLGEANSAVAEQLRIVNQRRFRGQDLSRRALFEQLERPALRPPPQTRYEFAIWKPARVNIHYHVGFADHYYSVPYQLARETVEVRATARLVELSHRGRRVASHVRECGRRRFVTNPDHIPASHRAHLEWTPSKLVTWGTSIGPSVAELVETILRTRPHPEHGYRACLGLMRLVRRYGSERVSAACTRALATGSVSFGRGWRVPRRRISMRASRVRCGAADALRDQYGRTSMWSHQPNGITIAQVHGQYGVRLYPANNDRTLGWQRVHDALAWTPERPPLQAGDVLILLLTIVLGHGCADAHCCIDWWGARSSPPRALAGWT
jgi:transposase